MIYVSTLTDKSLPINTTTFPDSTSQVWKLDQRILDSTFVQINWQFSNEGELMQIAQLKDLLDCNGVEVRLLMTYLPYGRQDKEVDNSATFALFSFARLINELHFSEVVIQDPHSEVALELLNNSTAYYPIKRLEEIAQEIGGDIILCYPDKGAVTKYTKVYETLYRPHIYGEKVRDQATGNILSYKLVGECAGKNVLIVDDICDGGMTFKLLTKDLLAAGANSVVLFVTHGIFSKGVRTLLDAGISRVFTSQEEVFARNQTNFV